MATTGLNAVGPFFAILALGFLMGRYRLLPEGSSEALTRFVFLVSLPALVIVSLARTPVEQFFDWDFLGVLGGGMLIVYGLGFGVARHFFPGSLTAHALHGLAAMFSSTAYMGLPLLLTIFGDIALVPGIIGTVITGAVFASIAIVIAEFDRGGDGELWTSLRGILTSPPIVSTAIGLTLSSSGLVLPAAVTTVGDLLGGAFVPCMLFAAGLFLATCSLAGAKAEVGWLVFVKLVIHPAITWVLAFQVFVLDPTLAAIAVIQAALPIGVPVFVFAQTYGVFVTRASVAIAWSTGLSVATLSAVLYWLSV
ncbi:MAG: AEC family transporter [Pseudomonadota bacterium]